MKTSRAPGHLGFSSEFHRNQTPFEGVRQVLVGPSSWARDSASNWSSRTPPPWRSTPRSSSCPRPRLHRRGSWDGTRIPADVGQTQSTGQWGNCTSMKASVSLASFGFFWLLVASWGNREDRLLRPRHQGFLLLFLNHL